MRCAFDWCNDGTRCLDGAGRPRCFGPFFSYSWIISGSDARVRHLGFYSAIGGVSIRVPTPNVSCVDLTFEASRDTTVNEINAAFEAAAAEGALKGVLGTTNEPLVSMDFNHDSRSSIVALDQTKVMAGTMCRILSWYDNEWGFSNRMLDTATQMAKFL